MNKWHRIVYCAITDLGGGLVDRLDEPMMRASQEALDPLNEREQRALIGMLDELRAGHAPLFGEKRRSYDASEQVFPDGEVA